MEWKLSEEQETYRDTFRDWLGDVASTEQVRRWQDEGDRTSFPDRLARDGWIGVGIPEERGGQGGGLVELALTAEELGRSAAPDSAWLATVLATYGLGELPDGTSTWLSPADEPPSPAGLSVAANGSLSGMVPRVLAGADARGFVVVVGEPGAYEVRHVEAGESVTLRDRKLLDRSRSVADVAMESTPSTLLEVDAAEAMGRAADVAAVLVAADALGAMERMLELAVEYSLQRHQFGVPIGSFQAVKHAAATIEVDVEAGRSAVYFAAASVEAGLPEASLHAAAVKAQVTAAAARASDVALTMHGAIGYTWEHDLHLFYKRAKLDEHLSGAPALWNERIADGLSLV